MITKTLEYTEYGWRAVAYCDQTNREGAWYGSRSECENVDVSRIDLRPLRRNQVDPFDLACERRYD